MSRQAGAQLRLLHSSPTLANPPLTALLPSPCLFYQDCGDSGYSRLGAPTLPQVQQGWEARPSMGCQGVPAADPTPSKGGQGASQDPTLNLSPENLHSPDFLVRVRASWCHLPRSPPRLMAWVGMPPGGLPGVETPSPQGD